MSTLPEKKFVHAIKEIAMVLLLGLKWAPGQMLSWLGPCE
jgi:hypothetical protein